MKRESKYTSWFWPLAPATLIITILLLPSSNAFSIVKTTERRPFISDNDRRKVYTPAARRTLSSFSELLDDCARRDGSSSSSTRLLMYNLPPAGGGGSGGGGKNDIAAIVKGAFSIFLIVGFFISPLGGLVLGILNSFLVLLFLLPVIATVGFQIWQSLNTLSGTCPNCGAPATVLKQKQGQQQPSMCFNCGITLQANDDNTEINNVSGRTSIDDLTSGRADVGNIFDILYGRTTTTSTTKSSSSSSTGRPGASSSKSEDVIVDVDVVDNNDDKPFQ